ncbi:peptidylprolyl isomerase fpr4 [Trapelia coarctata]|nr:peptidylprolyl isomerase fpr4 [Trapelia coarctata]
MSGLLPAAVYGLEVPAGDVMISAVPDFPSAFRITMAAIDPSAEPEFAGMADGDGPVRATLKLIRQPIGPDDDSEDESEDEAYMDALLNGDDSEDDDEESSSDDEDKHGGPSDPSKSKKARRQAAVEQLKKALAEDDSDDDVEMDGTNGINGTLAKLDKGKAKATDDDEDSDDGDSEDLEIEEFVICTLDPTKNYQQPLDITIGEDERVFFKVSGTHTIYLTGNYVIPVDDGINRRHEVYDEDEEDYDLSPDEDELDDDEEDLLDALADPRITEVDSDEEEEKAPKLIKAEKKESKKGKNKRPAADSDDEEAAGLDDIMAKSLKPAEATTNGEPKLSKKQLKKLKNNAGKAVVAEEKNLAKTEQHSTDSPNGKKVQFAKNLEQGPSGPAASDKSKAATNGTERKKDGDKEKAALGVKTVQGVKIDDKKLGTGPAATKGKKVSMRYIGKLQDGKVFDSNKKGKPFSFKLGAGEVIKGWDIGVAGMSVGGERRITVPANLAYGKQSQPGIPPNSVLVFDLKLLEIN